MIVHLLKVHNEHWEVFAVARLRRPPLLRCFHFLQGGCIRISIYCCISLHEKKALTVHFILLEWVSSCSSSCQRPRRRRRPLAPAGRPAADAYRFTCEPDSPLPEGGFSYLLSTFSPWQKQYKYWLLPLARPCRRPNTVRHAA